jgi:release factor glutamine methyltransferase
VEYSETIPIQYEKGYAEFMGMKIQVSSDVFIPRPETELLVNVVATSCRKMSKDRAFILDVGTGSGNIPVGLLNLMENCRVVGLDVSSGALAVAGENIRRFKMEEKITLLRSDMFDALRPEHRGYFDAVVSNPPYVSSKDYERVGEWVKREPRIALLSGDEGMDHIGVIAEKSGYFLKEGGFLALEVGYDQGRKTKELLKKNGFTGVKGYYDFNEIERVITGWKNG